VVDDESMLLAIFREWLEEANYRVLTAGDGAAALQILGQEHVDVIVSDVRMPVMDGILLLKNLTSSGLSKSADRPRMIFISGFTDLEPREAYGLGVEALMQKPIKHEEFLNTVRRTLRRAREGGWTEPFTSEGLQLHVSLPPVSEAIEQGRIAFGQGGFCLRCTSPIREGPVRFDLEFEREPISFAGHGFVRWADLDECLLGVEISNLDEPCRDRALHLISANAGPSYIPSAPVSAAPGRKIAE
jgi:CheY-like chemotaxis protein